MAYGRAGAVAETAGGAPRVLTCRRHRLALHAGVAFVAAAAVVKPAVISAAVTGWQWTIDPGALPAGGDFAPPANVTLQQAERICRGAALCNGFTFKAASSTPKPSEVIEAHFKIEGGDVRTDEGWWSYSKPPDMPQPSFSYHGCATAASKAFAWCDQSLPAKTRIDRLLSALTLQEKISLISPNASVAHNTCNMHTAGIPRLGLPQYMWLDETNTGASASCLGPGHCVTTFSGPVGLAASFNRSMWKAKGVVLGTEVRALNNIGWYRDAGGTVTEKIGLTGFGPNLNQPRDPRNGRLSEVPGEDPYLAGEYGVAMLQGMQQEDAHGYPLMAAFVKHFLAYSQETGRGYDTFNITKFDLYDTYLPAYEAAFKRGGASGLMCSYNGENGHPSCANGALLNDVVRRDWNQPDILVATDCGAVANMRHFPANAPNNSAASAWVLNNGTDLEMGSSLFLTSLVNATAEGLTDEASITRSARRALIPLFRTGLYDNTEKIEWSTLGSDSIGSAMHQRVRDEAALQSFVLLKNHGGLLPLNSGIHIAVLGPQSTGTGLFSDYFGDDVCWSPHPYYQSNTTCAVTIANSIAAENHGGITTVASGVDMSSKNDSQIAAALALARAADVVILALGIDKSIEHEGVDRRTITLPGLQDQFAQQVIATGKPVVLILTNGGPLAIDNLTSGSSAIIEAFNPGFGAPMLARTIFGKDNRWGKMPYTVYPAEYTAQIPLDTYSMSNPPGRTYRYYNATPLFRFGEGLSYTTFEMDCSCNQTLLGGQSHSCDSKQKPPISVYCMVRNTGSLNGDEVITVYHSAGAEIRSMVDHPVPFKSLVDFERVSLGPNSSTTVKFILGPDAFELVNNSGSKVFYPGPRTLIISRGVGTDVEIVLSPATLPKTVGFDVKL